MIGEPIELVRFDSGDLDPSVDPLVDLDAFVNARWRAANPVPPDRSAWDSFAVLKERSLQIQAAIAVDAASGKLSGHAARVVGDLWASGMDALAEASVDGLRDEIRSIEALQSITSIVAYIGERHGRGWPLLFGFDIAADFDDPAVHIACVFQAGLGVADPDFYRDPDTQALRAAYADHLAGLLAWSGIDTAQTHALADDVVAFERRLAAASMTPQALARDVASRQQRISLAEAEAITPGFSWRSFFDRQGLTSPPVFSLAVPAFHREWNVMLRDTPLPVWRAYLACHTMTSVAADLGGALGQLHHRFHAEALRGRHLPVPRWKQVIATIDALAGDAMGELYVSRVVSARAKERVQALVERLRVALRARIIRLDWMGESTRAYALRKLDAMRAKIAHPVRWRDWSGLRTSPDDWLGNLLAARAFDHAWMLSKMTQPVDADEWRMTPQTVNAGYDPQRNQIVFPAAILQPPFFDEHADDALNYGGIGAVIAHEMTHGYDDQGSRFGVDGRLENWWNDEDRARFENRAQSLVTLIERDHVVDGKPVNGRLTLGENMADFGGLAIAYDALCSQLSECAGIDPAVDGHTQRQRFFLAWATIWRQNLNADEARRRWRIDPHAPASVRANAAATNMPEFSLAFGANAEHSPARVRLW
jgi:putative endopeptidase